MSHQYHDRRFNQGTLTVAAGTQSNATERLLSPEETKSLIADVSREAQRILAKQLEKLEGSLTLPGQADSAAKRKAVAAQYGQVVAESLAGTALDEMYGQVDPKFKPKEEITASSRASGGSSYHADYSGRPRFDEVPD